MPGSPVLSVRGLHVSYQMNGRWLDVLHGVDLDIAPGETIGVVGESGSGKSTLAFAIMRYLAKNGRIRSGEILFHGEDLVTKREPELRLIRGSQLGMVYQDPHSSLNPSLRIGDQIAEIVRAHRHVPRSEAWRRAVEMLERVQLPEPDQIARRYPHQTSGGQRQRVVIAMALVCNPSLLIMDEPTTALDVTTEAHILDLVADLKREFNSAILFITHNLAVIARVADRVAVVYAGQIIEEGPVQGVFTNSRHPYTVGLRTSLPRLDAGWRGGLVREIAGRIPPLDNLPSGCLFQPRCAFARAECSQGRPAFQEAELDHRVRCLFWREVDPNPAPIASQAACEEIAHPTEILTTQRLTKQFGATGGLSPFGGRRRATQAVSDVSLQMNRHETLAIVGESGSGKTTLARTIAGLEEPTGGQVDLNRTPLPGKVERRSDAVRRELQMIFQNPDSSLNPRHSVMQIVGRPLQRFSRVRKGLLRDQVADLLRAVNLDDTYLDRYPDQLSGGEKQRLSIARAFAGDPDLVLCDEAVSALDVSVQASMLNLLLKLQRRRATAYLFISHDLRVVRYLADRIAVMYGGKVVEQGTAEQIFAPPYHPYTEALLSAIPLPDPNVRQTPVRLDGAFNPREATVGCRFAARCPRKLGSICETTPPPAVEAAPGHVIMCHIPLEQLCQQTDLPFADARAGAAAKLAGAC